jgi:hypothetical protein
VSACHTAMTVESHTHTHPRRRQEISWRGAGSFRRFGRWPARVPAPHRTYARVTSMDRWFPGRTPRSPDHAVHAGGDSETPISRSRALEIAQAAGMRTGNARWPTTWSRLWAACECGGRTSAFWGHAHAIGRQGKQGWASRPCLLHSTSPLAPYYGPRANAMLLSIASHGIASIS